MSSGLGERLKAHWLAQGLSVHPRVTREQLRSFEARHAICIPDDLRDFLSVVNGTGRYSNMGDRMFCFWSLDEFTPLSEEHPEATCFEEPNAFFLFADHSINL